MILEALTVVNSGKFCAMKGAIVRSTAQRYSVLKLKNMPYNAMAK